MIDHDLSILDNTRVDVCVIGSGPVGICLAVDLKARGLSVLVLESGLSRPSKEFQSLSDARIVRPRHHHPMDYAVCRCLGGGARLWGGRCVPLDEVDFSANGDSRGGWPFPYQELARFHARAAELVGSDEITFRSDDWREGRHSNLGVDRLESWVNETRIDLRLRAVGATDGIPFVLNATVVDIEIDPTSDAIRGIVIARADKRTTFSGARTYVLALGGVENARLLLNVQTKRPRLFGGSDGALGRYYMGHLSTTIADIRFMNPQTVRYFSNEPGARSFRRRRLTLSNNAVSAHQLPNISFWPENPSFGNADHESGLLSAIALALAVPGIGSSLAAEAIRQSQRADSRRIWPHLRNIVADLPGLLRGVCEIADQRFRYHRRTPRLFKMVPSGIYPLRFHAEHRPRRENFVRLSNERDRLGARRAIVDFAFSANDAAGVLRAHEVLDRSLREAGVGELVFHSTKERAFEAILNCIPDGLHQLGLTRMAENRSQGIVDSDCRVFEFRNLYVAGSSVFPRSGQANPTFPAIALAVRLAERLARAS